MAPARWRGAGAGAGIIAAAATLALAGLVTFWWRDVPAFEGPHTFRALKGELAGVALSPARSDPCEQHYDLELRSSRGWSVRGYLRVPTCAGGARLPGVVVLGGIRTGRHSATLVQVREPQVVLGLDYPWSGPRRLTWLEFLRRLPEIRRSVLATPAALLLAADYLSGRRADVQADSLILVGASLGVPFAAAAAAVDERFTAVALVYGGGDLPCLINANFRRAYPRAPMWIARIGKRLAEPVEPLRYVAAVAPRPIVMVNGSGDPRIPASCVEALYAAAKEPKRLVWLKTSHITPRNDALLQAVMDAAMGALESLRAAAREAAEGEEGAAGEEGVREGGW